MNIQCFNNINQHPKMATTPKLVTPSDFTKYVIGVISKADIEPMTITDENYNNFHFLFKYQTNNSREIVTSKMREIHGCIKCSNRISKMYNIGDKKGSICRFLGNIDEEYNKHKNFIEIKDLCESSINSQKVIDIIVINNDSIYFPRDITNDSDNYNHVYIHVKGHIITSSTEEQIILYKNAIKKYVIDEPSMFFNFVNRCIIQGMNSFELMSKILDKVSYGNQFKPALNWIISVINDLERKQKLWTYFSDLEKIEFGAHHIIRAGVKKDFTGSVALLFQTAYNNILDILEISTDEQALAKLCSERLNPITHCRPTKEPTIGQAKTAISLLGNFQNSIMKVDDAMKIIPETVFHNKHTHIQNTSSSMFGFQKQIEKQIEKQREITSTSNPKNITSFASRCGPSSEIQNISTIREFVEYAKKNKNLTVEIKVPKSINIVYIAETTLPKEKINHRHFWEYLPKSANYTDYGIRNEWERVTATVPMYEYIKGVENFVFVIDGINKSKIRNSDKIPNCCFPSFLATEYQRVCGTSFEKLIHTTNVEVPDGDLMIGIGFSVINKTITTQNPSMFGQAIQLKVNGIPISITKY